MKFGAHVSIRDGYLGAAKKAYKMNARAFQFFPKNPRILSVKSFDTSDANECCKFCKENQLLSISHSPYPTSLVPDSSKRDKVIKSLLNDLQISDSCGSLGVVVHFGKVLNAGQPLESYQLMIEILNEVLKEWHGECKILLENNAGKPGMMGTTLEELVQVRKLTDFPEKIGFCLDTCHAFASGLWNGENWDEVVSKGKELDFFTHLKAVHLNNSKYPSESGKDRHANIFNQGYISEEQWDIFITSPVIKDVPLILETPDELGVTHEQEIKQLYKRWS